MRRRPEKLQTRNALHYQAGPRTRSQPGWWPPAVSPALSLQMAGEVLVHLEHGHLVLAEDPPELVVGQDFTAVLRVLQVVQADVLPHLAHHLAPRQRARADHRGQLLRRL